MVAHGLVELLAWLVLPRQPSVNLGLSSMNALERCT